MKWGNQLENRILILGTAIVMTIGFIVFLNYFVRPVYETQIKGLTKQVEINNKLIERLANDPKYQISNDFGKMKPKEGSIIDLNLDNAIDVKDSRITYTTVEGDTVKIEIPKKRSLWKRLFN